MLQKMLQKLRDHLRPDPFAPVDLTKIVGRATGPGRLRMPSRIYNPENMHIGQHIDIGEFCHIRAKGGLTIGDRVVIASHVVITTQGHPVSLPRWGKTEQKPIVIGNDVWIGANACILPGVTIGDGAVVAAGATLIKDVVPNTLVAGRTASKIRKITGEIADG